MEEERKTCIHIRAFNDHLTCVLCGGYYIDATAIVECLHTFCKTCIIRYLETSIYCPVCDTPAHETKPTLSLRPDKTLQDVVYKMVPRLLSNEIKRRKEFLGQTCDPGDSGICDESEIVDDNIEGRFYREDERMSVCLEFNPYGKRQKGRRRSKSHKTVPRRFLLCPALFTIGHFKRFIRTKHLIGEQFQVAIFHSDEVLPDHYTLMDVAYIYSWRRTGPLRLYYSFYEGPDPPLPTMKMPQPRRRENIEDWNKVEGLDSPGRLSSSPSSRGSRSPSPPPPPDFLRRRNSSSPVFERFSGLLPFGQSSRGSRLVSSSARKGRRRRGGGADDDDTWREPQSKKIKVERPDDGGDDDDRGDDLRTGSCAARSTPNRSTSSRIPESLRFTPLRNSSVSSRTPRAKTTTTATTALSSSSSSLSKTPIVGGGGGGRNARLSLSVTIPKNFIKDLLIARDIEKTPLPTTIKTEAPDNRQ